MSWPTALWSLGSVGIYVSEFDPSQDAVVGEVHVLDAPKSTKHHSGSMGKKVTLGGVLVTTGCGGPELETLYGYTEVNTTRAITSDMGDEGNWYVLNIKAKRKQALNVPYPVYDLRIDLSES